MPTDRVPRAQHKASGVFNMFRFLGGAFGIALAVAVFTVTGNQAKT